MLFWKRIWVGDNERAILFRRNRFAGILGPGRHTVYAGLTGLSVELHSVSAGVYTGEWADFLVKNRPDVVAANFTKVETGDGQIAVVYADGRLLRVLAPACRVLYWKGPREISFDLIDLETEPEVPKRLIPALQRLGPASCMTTTVVEESGAGLLYLDGQFTRVLAPGVYAFWSATRGVRVDLIDLRSQIMEAPGQEILTRDKVSIRVTILAEYRVLDPAKAAVVVKGYADRLYRLLQLAIRQTLGKRSLDEVLAEKVDVDPAAADAVRAEMAVAGVEVGRISLKDIILPGEIRVILNQVVAAEKQAQANLIRRREETAATRSLLNTAKLMEDNPVLVRLKELETLERLTEKVEHLTVHGGFETLLTRLLPSK